MSSIHNELRQAALPPGYEPGKDQPYMYNHSQGDMNVSDFLNDVRRGMGKEPIELPEGHDYTLVPNGADLDEMAKENGGLPMERIFPLHTQLDDPNHVGDLMEGDPEFEVMQNHENHLHNRIKNEVTPNNAALSSVHYQLKRSSYGY